MEHLIIVILMVVAVVCLFLEAFGVAFGRANLGWFGLGCWAAAVAIGVIA